MPETYSASLVRIGTQAQVPREVALASKGAAVDTTKLDMAFALAKFFVPLITESKTETAIELRLSATMLVPTNEVPKGVVHTKIIFQEAPRE